MPLDQSQVSTLEKELDRQYVALLLEVRDELVHSEDRQYVELTGRCPADSGESSMGDVLADTDPTLFNSHITRIREIESATTRISKNVFGECIDCEQDIPFARLKAFPTAKRCVSCQERHHKSYAYQSSPAM